MPSCVACILATWKSGEKEGLLHLIPEDNLPLSTYHMDNVTASKKMYRYVFVIVDAFTKFVWIFLIKSTITEEVLQKLGVQQATFGTLTE